MQMQNLITRLLRLSAVKQLLCTTIFSVLGAMLIVSGVGLLLKGEVSTDYLLTGFVASLCVSVLVSQLMLHLTRQQISLNLASTEAIKNEALLQARLTEQHIYESIFEESPIPYALYDYKNNRGRLNPAFTRTFGYTEEDIPTLDDWGKKVYPDPDYGEWARTTWQLRLEHHKRQGTPFEPLELDIRCKDGSTKTAMVGTASTGNALGGLDLVVFYDITRQKHTEKLLKSSVAQYRQIIDMAPFPIVMISMENGHPVYGNKRAELLLEVSLEHYIGATSEDLYVNPEDRARLVKAVNVHGHVYDVEIQLKTKQGRVFWALVSTTAVDIDGHAVAVSCINDIDDRKQAEQARLHEAQRYRDLIESVAIPVALSDIETGTVLYSNKRAQKLFRAPPGQGTGRQVTDFYCIPEQRKDILTMAMSGQPVSDYELQMRRWDGQEFWALLSATVVDFEGKPSLLTSINDIDARKQAEEALSLSAQRFKNLINNAPFPIVVTDIAGSNLLYANHATEEMYSGSLEKALGEPTSQFFVDPEFHRKLRATGMEHLDQGDSKFEYEAQLRTLDGRTIWALLSIAFIDFDGDPALITSISDITTHKLAAETMQRSAERYMTLLETAPFPIVVADIETGMVLYDNHRAAALFGLTQEEVVGRTTMEAYVNLDERRDLLEKLKQRHQVQDQEVVLQRKDGSHFWALLSVSVIAFEGKPALLTAINDITERKQLEIAREESRKLLQTVLQTMPLRVFWKDRDSRYMGCNAAFAKDAGVSSPDEMLGKTDFDMGWRDQAELYRADDKLVMASGSPKLGYIEPQTTPDGERIWLETSKAPLVDGENKVIGMVGIYDDITERKLAEDKIALAARVFSEAHEGILITDANGAIIDVNPTFTEITGYNLEEVIGKDPSMLKSGRQGPEYYAEMWADLASRGFWRGEIWNRKKDGSIYAELLTISALRDDQGEIRNYIGLFSDITQSKYQQQRLELLANFDPLTSLPNRTLFADRFNQALARCKRDNNTMLAVCYLDLDGFKKINDTLGHEAGDALLVQVAERIKSLLREEDTVSRLGGDEFALLMGDIRSIDQCTHALGRIHRAISQPYLLGNDSVSISASSGLAIYPLDDADPDTLLRHADQAMYEAKQAGRNRFHLFDAEHDQQIQHHRLKLESVMQAFERGEFELHYQPKVNLKTGEVFGAEALIRWMHPERGIVRPLEFLPVLQGTVFEISLGNWVIEHAMQQIEIWAESGMDLQVSVNVSPHHLQEATFFAQLDEALGRHPGVRSGQFEIEVLESCMVEDMATITGVLGACHGALGVSIALDDFGTGYSSLTHLRHLPANAIKIDQTFVRDMLDDPDDFAIIEGVIGLAHAFRRDVIAEGVETNEHGLMLMMMGCTLAQGYGIARPMPADQIPAWSRQYKPFDAWKSLAANPLPVESIRLALLVMGIDQWVQRMEACLQAPADETPPWPIMQPKDSHAGRWLMEANQGKLFSPESLEALEQAHETLHRIGNALRQQYLEGHLHVAREGLNTLNDARTVIAKVIGQMQT